MDEYDLIRVPLSESRLRLLGQLAGGVMSLVSRKSPKYKAYAEHMENDDEWFAAMQEEPRLIRRPLWVVGETLLIGFDPQQWEAALAQIG